MMGSRANVRPFNAHVLIGNWYEDRVMEEEVLKDFLEKRYTGQLASQKMSEVEKMSQGVSLSVPAGDSLLRFGHQVILVNKWIDSENFTGDQKEASCLLSTGISYPASSYDNKQAIQMTASGTTMMRPTQRTALIIQKSPYGREFEIMCELSTGSLSAYKSPILWTFTTQSSY
ncbi:unnamed protein product [Didymodactylos carnosus]|uniref:Uncharacterized protein n=1 Tax=Didymodactylos carnosus TaxID=1234261 RepID=A0A813UF45_9BILA|nr:unnamed protein product [Didymodactylos carnosus]CAF0971139.1 unnamed protein product [Didymodactylos carnosus]CAF3615310.1 unnamed protein product [Didymodactylos carnosus]CAF3742520.1 unnamed protein product [Didymodactylos carnosus]